MKTTNQINWGEKSEGSKTALFSESYFEGLNAKYQGDNAAAKAYFEQCLKINPGEPTVLFELAKIQVANYEMDAAQNILRELVDQYPENIWYREYLVQFYQMRAQYPMAVEVMEELSKEYPDNLSYYYELGSMYLMMGQDRKAAEVYENLQGKTGFNPEISEQIARIYTQIKDYDKAEEVLKQLIAYNPEELRYYNMLANLYQQKGNTQESIELFEKLKLKYPEDPFIYISLSDYYRDAGDKEKARQNLEEAFALETMDIDTRVSILMNFYNQTETNEELKELSFRLLEETVEAYPEEAKAWAIYGDFLIRDGKSKDAREKYLKALEHDKSKWVIWSQLMFLDSELADNESLITHSKEAIDLFPNQALSYFLNGIAHYQEETYDTAYQSLNQASKLVVGNPQMEMQIYGSMGDAAYQIGNYQDAWKSYERALKIDPTNAYVLNNYAYFLSLQKKDLDKAAKMSKETVNQEPNSATYLDTYGWILFQMGDYSEAEKYLQKAIMNGGDESGEVLEHYGDVLYKLNRTDEANQYWNLALETNDHSEDLRKKIENPGKFFTD
jgi:tetratricopeptide (TPR) repeat protein